MVIKLEIALPVLLVIIAFIYKLWIDRQVTLILFIHAFYELPVDIYFLSLSFLVASIITPMVASPNKILYLLIAMVISFLGVIGWRKSITYLENEREPLSGLCFVINCTIAILCLIKSINILMGGL
jgi:hypothetical protein